jgi:hypothetical protein
MVKHIERAFNYHKPKEERVIDFNTIRATAKDLAFLIDDVCPVCREQSLAITKLEECVMWAIAAIAREEG